MTFRGVIVLSVRCHFCGSRKVPKIETACRFCSRDYKPRAKRSSSIAYY
ncbi:MAG: hypothetical protein M1407_05175 [Deltaproteobacteria bacterium]|nr:hypothetical protein [Deltaproteobacteria bacterium]